ncbi:MAG: hypothetical protein ACU0DH_01685 [Paracoccus sp. (in: a-proteobacteria)]
MMLVLWPAVAAVLFSQLPHRAAIIWTILAGYLLLPPVVGIDLPLLPPVDKHGIPAIAALVGALALRTQSPLHWQRPEWWVLALVALALVTPVVTMATNPEPLIVGITYRPGLGLFDALNGVIGAVVMLLPFLLGYMVLSSTDGVRAWMAALLLAGLAYSLPMLLEVRMSPQLNVWIYGFFAHDFSQAIRYGGYRPMVFLEHGLWVALFGFMAVIAATLHLREGEARLRLRNGAVLAYLLVVLFLCKSAASLIYAVLLVPMVLLAPPVWQVRLAALLALTVLVYPLLRWLNLFPVDAIRDLAMSFDAERGRSLEFRFANEDLLLERASQKPLAGWGGWGRNLDIDPISGRFATVSDGYWVVMMTISGIIGYVATFGLLCGSLIRLWIAARASAIDRWTAGLALMMAANLVDLVPNATVTPLTWLSLGAVAGLAARGVTVPQDAGVPRVKDRPRMRTVIG